jgi:hypothetical protein
MGWVQKGSREEDPDVLKRKEKKKKAKSFRAIRDLGNSEFQ